MTGDASPPPTALPALPRFTLAALGVGAGRTAAYDAEPSSSFALCADGAPLLLLDAGAGAVAAFQRAFPGSPLPALVYCSHNHTDHAGELPVVLAVEAARRGFITTRNRRGSGSGSSFARKLLKPLLRCFSGRGSTTTPPAAAAAAVGAAHARSQPLLPLPPLTLIAERTVMRRLRRHRLAELRSTGRALDEFARFLPLREGKRTELLAPRQCGGGCAGVSDGGNGQATPPPPPPPLRLGLTPLRARHAERAFGLLIDVAVAGSDGGGGNGGGDTGDGRNGAAAAAAAAADAAEPQLLLGWTADSGTDAGLYAALAKAPAVLADARAAGTAEHAGFDQVAEAATTGPLRGRAVLAYGYGRADEAPTPADHPKLCVVTQVLRAGDVVALGVQASSL